MSDFPYVGPPPGGLSAAMTTARRRRLRTAGTTSGLSAMSLLVVALLVGQTGRTNLVQGPKTEIPAVTPETPDRDAKGPQAVAGTSNVALGPATLTFSTTTAGSTAASQGSATSAGPPPDTRSTQPTAQLPPRSTYKAGPLATDEGLVGIPTCSFSSDGSNRPTICASTSTSTASQPEGSLQLYADVCSTETSVSALHFPTAREVDFVVTRAGKEVWRWSTWHADSDRPHTRRMQPGTCTTWTFPWTEVDRSGQSLAAGAYTLTTTFSAVEVSTAAVQTTDFNLS